MTCRIFRPIPLKAIFATLCLSLCATGVLADSVKLGGFWFNNVTVQDIDDGNLIFTNVTGAEQVRPMLEVQGLKLSVFDDSAAADDALKAKDYQEVLITLFWTTATVTTTFIFCSIWAASRA